MSEMEEYAGRIQAILWDAAEWIPTASLNQARRLADAGENGDAMIYVAWAIVNEGEQVPHDLIERIREHAAGLIEESHMPNSLEAYGV